MKSELSIITPPASELPLAAVKNYCRISNTNDDTTVLPMLIQSARERAEQYCGRAFLQQTLEVYYTEIEREFYLPRPPVVSVSSAQLIYLDESSNLTLNSDYYLMGQQDCYIVLTATTYNLPKGFSPNDDLSRFNLKVQYVAGYDTVWPFKTDGTTQASKVPMGICEHHDVPTGNKDVLNIMLGSLGTAWITIVSYYFGSSSGSAEKNQQIKSLTDKLAG